MTAFCLARMPNWGLDREGLRSGRPIIGSARTRFDLSPYDRQHLARDDHWGMPRSPRTP